MNFEAIVQEALDKYSPIQEKVELIGAAKLVADLNPSRIAELGVYRGGSLFVWHAVSTNCKIVGVDTPGTPDEVRDNMRRWLRPGEESLLLLADTKNPATADQAVKFLGGPIDFLFIDADHDYPSVSTDFKVWSPHVRSGGLIGFHDILVGPETPKHIEVWKLWAELKAKYPESYEFYGPAEHQYGIGVVRV